MSKIQLACPICQTRLQLIDDLHLRCAGHDLTFTSEDGIWRMLRPGREQDLHSLTTSYEAIRRAEQRGSDDPAYYRYLPFHDKTDRYQLEWHTRGERYLHFLAEVLQPYERSNGGLLTLLDLGAGSGWMSGRLAGRGHSVAAVDVSTSAMDGLGAYPAYGDEFLPIQAEFAHLPFEDHALEVVILNDALHYSDDQRTTLQESLRVLKHGGLLAILDTPIYRDAETGERVVTARQDHLAQITGLPLNALAIERILTFDGLRRLGQDLGISWSWSWPLPAWRRTLHRLREQQSAAQYPVIYTHKP